MDVRKDDEVLIKYDVTVTVALRCKVIDNEHGALTLRSYGECDFDALDAYAALTGACPERDDEIYAGMYDILEVIT